MKSGVFAFYGKMNRVTIPSLESYIGTFHMPYVTPSASANHSLSPGDVANAPTPSFTIKVRPLYDRAIVDLIEEYRWKRIHYLYDTSEGEFI